MGKKYIIELEDKPFHNGNGDFLYRVKGFNSLVFDMTGVGKLTPYTEPDLEQIKADWYKAGREAERVRQPDIEQVRKEAYRQGYDTGYGTKVNEFYEQGLTDAWDAARNVIALSTVDRREVFGSEYMYSILEKHTASEAIEKIQQYEQEKEEIQVGDEVDDGVANLIVLEINEDGTVKGFDDSGSIMHATPRKKTGRHFPEIAEVLQKMREE